MKTKKSKEMSKQATIIAYPTHSTPHTHTLPHTHSTHTHTHTGRVGKLVLYSIFSRLRGELRKTWLAAIAPDDQPHRDPDRAGGHAPTPGVGHVATVLVGADHIPGHTRGALGGDDRQGNLAATKCFCSH